MQGRLGWVDGARGVGIVLVVFGHVQLGLVSAGLEPGDGALGATVAAIYTFHMPLFFFLAGLFVQEGVVKRPAEFWTNRVALLAYTYVIWSMLQGGLQIAFAEFSNHPASTRLLAHILWEPSYQFWFLYALFWARVAYALLHRLGAWQVFALAAALFALARVVELPLFGMLSWSFLYLAAGAALSAAVRNRQWPGAAALGAVVLFGLAVALEAASGWRGLLALPAAAFGIAGTILATQHVAAAPGLSPLQRVLALLGRASMSIFVMHVVAAAAMRAVLTKGFGVESVALHLVLGTLAGVLLPLAAKAALDRARLSAWFGLTSEFPVLRRGARAAANPARP